MAGWICPGCNLMKPAGGDCETCGKSDPKVLAAPRARETIGEGDPDWRRDQVMHDTLGEDELDEMISKGFGTTLATLFKRAKKKGLIKPQQDWYHDQTAAAPTVSPSSTRSTAPQSSDGPTSKPKGWVT